MKMVINRRKVVGRIVLAGDVCPIGRVEALLVSGNAGSVFGDTMPLLAGADLAVMNLEAALCRSGKRIQKLGPCLSASPEVAGGLKASGVDVCCLANNHVMDFGVSGLKQTLASLNDAGIRHFGAGADPATAGGPLFRGVKGIRIALLNFGVPEGALGHTGPGVARIDAVAVRCAVVKARRRAAVVVVVLHAGREMVLFPAPGMQRLCRELVDAGAAAVVCHHPHVVQGIEIYRKAPIAYSLGNFIFDWHEPEPETDVAMLLELGVCKAGVASVAVHPCRKSKSGGIELMHGAARMEFLRFLHDISAPLGDEGLLRSLWTEQSRGLFKTWYALRLARGADLTSSRKSLRQRAVLTFLNLMEDCEHGDAIKATLAAEAAHAPRSSTAGRRLRNLRHRLLALAGARSWGSSVRSPL